MIVTTLPVSLTGREPGGIHTIGGMRTSWDLRADAVTGRYGWTVLHRSNSSATLKASLRQEESCFEAGKFCTIYVRLLL